MERTFALSGIGNRLAAAIISGIIVMESTLHGWTLEKHRECILSPRTDDSMRPIVLQRAKMFLRGL